MNDCGVEACRSQQQMAIFWRCPNEIPKPGAIATEQQLAPNCNHHPYPLKGCAFAFYHLINHKPCLKVLGDWKVLCGLIGRISISFYLILGCCQTLELGP